MDLTRRALPALVGVALAVSACGGGPSQPPSGPSPAAAGEGEDAGPDAPEPEPEAEPAGFAPLTGAPLDEGEVAELAERPLLAVKVANAPSARPQAGLEVADVVVEEVVEGGITRFIAVFHSQLPDQVGPVRSARPVDAVYMAGFPTSVFAHSGARAEVQAQLRASPFVSLEEGAPGFVRTSDRRRPDNLFVEPTDVLAAGVERGAVPLGEDAGWGFSDEPPGGAIGCPDDDASCDEPGRQLAVSMSAAVTTGWTYDADAGRYRRDQDGSDTTVTGDGRVGAANVVVLATRQFSSGCCDGVGSPYLDTDLTGGGRALVLRDGQRFEARWEKDAAADVLRLVDDAGEPFPLAAGPTWMLLPPESRFPA